MHIKVSSWLLDYTIGGVTGADLDSLSPPSRSTAGHFVPHFSPKFWRSRTCTGKSLQLYHYYIRIIILHYHVLLYPSRVLLETRV